MAFSIFLPNTGFTKALLFFLALFGLIIGGTKVSAQSYNYRFHNFSIEEGLSNSGVSAIIQDSLGFIWIATDEGLNRFDGYGLKVYKNNPLDSLSIPNDNLMDLAQDKQGNIWIATEISGLIRFNPKEESFEEIKTREGKTEIFLKGQSITSLFIDDQDVIWVGTREIGLVRYDYTTGDTKIYSNNPENENSISSNRIFKIISADKENLWISTTQTGLNKFNKNTEVFEHYRHNNSHNSISTDRLRSIYQDTKGILWIGSTHGGLTRYDPKKGVFKTYLHSPENANSLPSNEAYSISEDKDGRIWVGTWARGLSVYNPRTDLFQNYWHNPSNFTSIPGNIITCIFRDRSDKMWFGFDNAGIAYFDAYEQNFTRYQHDTQNPNSITGNKIRSVFEDSFGYLWIGTVGAGLNKYDRENDKLEIFVNEGNDLTSMPNNTAWSIYEDMNSSLWIGTTSGLALYNQKTNSFRRYPFDTRVSDSYKKNNILKVTGDKKGNLYLGTWGGGLNKFNPKTELWEEITFKDDFENGKGSSVKHLLVDKDNNLWVGITSGLAKYELDTQEWTYFNTELDNEATSSFTNITALFESSTGTIWIGSDKGLIRFNTRDQSFKLISVKDGLSSRMVAGIGEDLNGLIWVATQYGLNSIDPQNYSIENYFKEDGLQSNEFNEWAFSQTKEHIYFGGVNGLIKFSPQNFTADIAQPEVALTQFLVFNREVKTGDYTLQKRTIPYSRAISIDYSDYIFAFEFAALNATQPEKCNYAYKLDGFDKDWVYTSAKDRKAVYTNVPNGDYVFKVKTTNKAGIWNKHSTSLKVKIIPPWWKTWWAQILLYTVIIVFFTALYKIRTTFMRRQKIELENQVAQKTEEIATKNAQLEEQKDELESLNTSKDRLLSMISHDARTPLNSLKGLLFLFENTALTKAEFKKVVADVDNQINQITSFLENLSRWAKNQIHGTRLNTNKFVLKEIVHECTDLLATASKEKDLEVEVDIEASIILYADAEKLKFVMRNLLSNAIKFCDSKDKIMVSASLNKEQVEVTVEDTGIGIETEQLENLFDTHHLSLTGTSDEIGTGLGLALCKEYVQHFGGTIGVESTVGEGSKFWFTIPVSN